MQNTGKERRRHPRYAVSGRLPGQFYKAEEPLVVFLVDVSRSGLGVVFGGPIEKGDAIRYVEAGLQVDFEVRWIFEAEHKDMNDPLEANYRCGLMSKQDTHNVELMLRRYGSIQLEDLD